MRKSVFDDPVQKEILNRVEKLNADSRPAWGRLNAAQMLKHITEALKIVNGDLKLGDMSTFFTRTLLRYFILKSTIPSKKMLEKNPPQTMKEIDVVKSGLVTRSFEEEKKYFLDLFKRILSEEKYADSHPLMGKMRKRHWGYFMHSHIHYHFTQFGI